MLLCVFHCEGKFFCAIFYERLDIFAMPGSAASRKLDFSFLRTPSPLPTSIMPSKGDVIRYAKYLQEEAERGGRNHRNYPLAELASTVAKDVFGVWKSLVSQFSHPVTIEIRNLERNVKVLLERSKKTTESLKGKEEVIKRFFMESGDLFEVVSCR